MLHSAAVYGRAIFAHVRSALEYPADFWVMASAGGLWQVLQFAFITVLFGSVTSVGGWGYHEMLILAGFLSLSTAGTAVFWDGIWSTPTQVLKGELDYRIVRPTPVVLQVAATHIGMQAFGELTLGVAMVTFGWIGAGIALHLLPLALLMLLCAFVIQCALFTVMSSVNFWLKAHFPVFTWITNDVQREVMRFPLGIYPALVRIVATFALPFAFASFIPVQILTGRLPVWWAIGTLGAAVATVVIAGIVFRAGLRSYDSAGH